MVVLPTTEIIEPLKINTAMKFKIQININKIKIIFTSSVYLLPVCKVYIQHKKTKHTFLHTFLSV